MTQILLMTGTPYTGREAGPRQALQSKHAETNTAKDFATGSCMTCGSLVRWPRELRVFKCTICLTINDLGPRDLAGSGGPEGDSTSVSGKLAYLGRKRCSGRNRLTDRDLPVKPVSVEEAKSLVRHCIRSFLDLAVAAHRPTAETASHTQPKRWLAVSSTVGRQGLGTLEPPISSPEKSGPFPGPTPDRLAVEPPWFAPNPSSSQQSHPEVVLNFLPSGTACYPRAFVTTWSRPCLRWGTRPPRGR